MGDARGSRSWGLIFIITGAALGLWGRPCCAADSQVNVTMHHNHGSRDGLYIDPAFTQAAAAGLQRDLSFNGSISGHVYAQPLYIEGTPSGVPIIIAATEANSVYALSATDGTVVWQRQVGPAVPLGSLTCGNIDPVGITGTPVVDLPSRTLFFDAMTTPDGGATKKHLIYALNVDTGATLAGWPVDVGASVSYNGTIFPTSVQGQRGALAVINGVLYVPYGGFYGDCGSYHGWLVGVPLSNPGSVNAWATAARGGGAWAVGGVASDGSNPFIATGNTFNASTWGGGEAVLRFQSGPVFTAQAADFWVASNWTSLDASDTDIGGTGALLVDVPGANPSSLVVALGKDGKAYLLNRANLGGVGAQVASAAVSSSAIIQAAATYRTASGSYVAFCGNNGQSEITAFRINATSPPSITTVWSQYQNGRGSPFVTSTDGVNDVIVWGLGAEGDQRLHGFDGDTGAVIYDGGGSNEAMAGVRRINTGIVARGRIFVAADNKVYAFKLPSAASAPLLSNPQILETGAFQFSFSNTPGLTFRVFSSTSLALPISSWNSLGTATEYYPGLYEFTDPQPTNAQTFYRVQSP